MIVNVLKDAVARLEAEQKTEVEREVQRVKRDTIIPFNADIDKSLQGALAELQSNYTKQMQELQQKLQEERQALIDAGERKKNAFAEAEINGAIAVTTASYTAAIAELNQQIEQLIAKEG